MGQAEFYLVDGDERIKLKVYTANEAQLESVRAAYNSEDLERNGDLIMAVLAPPVFYDCSYNNNGNIGDHGDQNTTKEEWIYNGEPYILCV